MSSNFLISSINSIQKKDLNKIKINEKTVNTILKDNKNIIKNINQIKSKKLDFFQNKKILIDLEKSHQNSLILLDMIKKQTEKNIFKKYNTEKSGQRIINSNHEIIQDKSMKKKLLIIPIHSSLMMKNNHL